MSESNYGDDSFTDAKVKQSGLLDDLKTLGPDIGQSALTLIEQAIGKGKPYDDRTMLVCIDQNGRMKDNANLVRL